MLTSFYYLNYQFTNELWISAYNNYPFTKAIRNTWLNFKLLVVLSKKSINKKDGC